MFRHSLFDEEGAQPIESVLFDAHLLVIDNAVKLRRGLEVVIPASYDKAALRFHLIRQKFVTENGTFHVMVKVSGNYGHRDIDLRRNAFQCAPESFVPVTVGIVRMTDPVAVPRKFCAKLMDIHIDLRHIHHLVIVLAVLHHFRLGDRLLCIVYCPCSEDILPECSA